MLLAAAMPAAAAGEAKNPPNMGQLKEASFNGLMGPVIVLEEKTLHVSEK